MRTITKSLSMMFKGALLASACAFFATPTANADELKDHLVVHKQSGAKVYYVLEDTPVVTFNSNKLHVESKSVSDDHNLSDVDKFTFEKTTSLSEIAKGDQRITIKDNYVMLEGFTPGAVVTLNDMQGRVLVSTVVSDNGDATIYTTDIPTGVYVVSTSDGKTFKLYKK